MNLTSGYYWTWKQGSVGKVMRGTLKDANGPFEITGSLLFYAKLPGASTVAIDGEPCTPDPDQVNKKGQFTYTTDATTGNINTGQYRIEFAHVDGSVVTKFPDDPNGPKTFGKLVVTESLS